jgi:hypothetical protein
VVGADEAANRTAGEPEGDDRSARAITIAGVGQLRAHRGDGSAEVLEQVEGVALDLDQVGVRWWALDPSPPKRHVANTISPTRPSSMAAFERRTGLA